MSWTVLLSLLLPVLATGSDATFEARRLVVRNLYLSKSDKEAAPELFVSSHRATVLRFETGCDPERTRLLGWEGRFDPLLVGGSMAVIVPLQRLTSDDRFMLLVTLTDGTTLPFTVVAAQDTHDAQVNVFLDTGSALALQERLEEKSQEVRELLAENDRRQQEETSIEHALATLLAGGQEKLTLFHEREKWIVRQEGIKANVFVLDDRKRAAIIFEVTNVDPKQPWRLQEARLSSLTTAQPRAFALRMNPSEIRPGKSGRIAVITDMPSFDSRGEAEKLVLELFRDGGRRQGVVVFQARPLP